MRGLPEPRALTPLDRPGQSYMQREKNWGKLVDNWTQDNSLCLSELWTLIIQINSTVSHSLTLISKDMGSTVGFLNFQNFIDAPYKKEMQYFSKEKLEFVSKQHYSVNGLLQDARENLKQLETANATYRENMCTSRWKTVLFFQLYWNILDL